MEVVYATGTPTVAPACALVALALGAVDLDANLGRMGVWMEVAYATGVTTVAPACVLVALASDAVDLDANLGRTDVWMEAAYATGTPTVAPACAPHVALPFGAVDLDASLRELARGRLSKLSDLNLSKKTSWKRTLRRTLIIIVYAEHT